jgi:RNA polymerase Rpb1, domain 5/RNA polymerase Rpb1, domain 4
MHFFNRSFDKNRLKSLILWLLNETDEYTTLGIIEKLKNLGFFYATKGGLSLSIDDLQIPPQKSWILSEAESLVESNNQEYMRGTITSIERIQQLVDTWHRASESLKKEVINHFQSTDLLNPVYMMAFSGARGNISQVRQLVGMRGLMADPQGQIIGFPIRSNFREGLTVTEYMISCYGARKGLVDTALRTADAGYLTRRLVDVSQHVIVKVPTCSTRKGILVKDIKESGKILLSLKDRLIGRVLATNLYQDELLDSNASKEVWKTLEKSGSELKIKKLEKKKKENERSSSLGDSTFSKNFLNPLISHETTSEREKSFFQKGTLVAFRNQEISPALATKIASFKETVLVRSPLTCSAQTGICQMCYGWSLSEGRLVSLGEAVGIVAAQSIGEPGTQLTMRTFHTGGVFSGDVLDEIRSPFQCQVFFPTPLEGVLIRTPQGKIGFLTRNPGRMVCLFVEKDLLHLQSLEQLREDHINPISGENILTRETKKQEKVFDLAKSTILFVRQNEIVPKDFLLAESSSLENQKNERSEGKRVLFSEISGQVFLNRMAVGKTLDKNGKLISSSRDLGSIWILSSRICPTSSLLSFYNKGSHLVNNKTLLARAQFKDTSKQKELKKEDWSSYSALTEMSKGKAKSVILEKERPYSFSQKENSFLIQKKESSYLLNFHPLETMFIPNIGFFCSVECSKFSLLNEKGLTPFFPDKLLFPVQTYYEISTNDLRRDVKNKRKDPFQFIERKKRIDSFLWFIDSYRVQKAGQAWFETVFYNDQKGGGFLFFKQFQLFYQKGNVSFDSFPIRTTKIYSRKREEKKKISFPPISNKYPLRFSVQKSNIFDIEKTSDNLKLFRRQKARQSRFTRLEIFSFLLVSSLKNLENKRNKKVKTKKKKSNSFLLFSQSKTTQRYKSLFEDILSFPSRAFSRRSHVEVLMNIFQQRSTSLLSNSTSSFLLELSWKGSVKSAFFGDYKNLDEKFLFLTQGFPKKRWIRKGFPIGISTNLQGSRDIIPALYDGWGLWNKGKKRKKKPEKTLFHETTIRHFFPELDGNKNPFREKWIKAIEQIWKRKDRLNILKKLLVLRTIKSLISHPPAFSITPFTPDVKNKKGNERTPLLNFIENNSNPQPSKKKKTWKRNPMQSFQLCNLIQKRKGFDSSAFSKLKEEDHISKLRLFSWTQKFAILELFSISPHNSLSDRFRAPSNPPSVQVDRFDTAFLKPANPFPFSNIKDFKISILKLLKKRPVFKSKKTKKFKKDRIIIYDQKRKDLFLKIKQNLENKSSIHEKTCSVSLKSGWLYVPRKFSRITKLHKSYKPLGTGYCEGLEKISFEPWMVEMECLPRSLPWYKISSKDVLSLQGKDLFQIRIALGLKLFISKAESLKDFNKFVLFLLKQKSFLKFERKFRSLYIFSNSKPRFSFVLKKNFHSKSKKNFICQNGKSTGTATLFHHRQSPNQEQNVLNKPLLKKRFSFFALVRKIDSIPVISQKDYRKRFSKLSGDNGCSAQLSILSPKKEIKKGSPTASHYLAKSNWAELERQLADSQANQKRFRNITEQWNFDKKGKRKKHLKGQGNQQSGSKQILMKNIKSLKNSHIFSTEERPLLNFVLSPLLSLSLNKKEKIQKKDSLGFVVWRGNPKLKPKIKTFVRKRNFTHKHNNLGDSKKFPLLNSVSPDIFWQITPIKCFRLKDSQLESFFKWGVWKRVAHEEGEGDDDDSESYDIFGQKIFVDKLAESFEIEKAKRELIRREKTFSLERQSQNGVSQDSFFVNNALRIKSFNLYTEVAKFSPSLFKDSPFRPFFGIEKMTKKSLLLERRENSIFVPKGTYLFRFYLSPQSLTKRVATSPSILLNFRQDSFSGGRILTLSSLQDLTLFGNSLKSFSSSKFSSIERSFVMKANGQEVTSSQISPNFQPKKISVPINQDSNEKTGSLGLLFSPFNGEIPCKKSQDQIVIRSLLSEGKDSQILLNDDDFVFLSLKDKRSTVSVGQLVSFGQEIGEELGSSRPGQIFGIAKGKICLRKGQSVLFYAGGLSHVSHGQYIPSHSPLLTLKYKRLITGDIVQGIPKIEQFFEAPVTKDGEPLLNSLGIKLEQAFNRFKKNFSLPLAVRESISSIQEFVVEGIQKVYLSQGVLISDKHIEVIVRQMTNKVKIINGGNTGLLPGEYINLQKIESINLSTRGKRAEYEPVILGITQASLDSDSFISAASFQETTRILSRDSLQGKTDFLRGLKERVVLGDLIQAGTGLDENLAYGLATKGISSFANITKQNSFNEKSFLYSTNKEDSFLNPKLTSTEESIQSSEENTLEPEWIKSVEKEINDRIRFSDSIYSEFDIFDTEKQFSQEEQEEWSALLREKFDWKDY